MKFSANISMLFAELPFLERIDAAAAAGFHAVECWFPYDHQIAELADRLKSTNLSLVGINTPPGDTEAGDWGLAAQPNRVDEFREGFRMAADYALSLGVKGIHVMAGNLPAEGRSAALECIADNLEYCAEFLCNSGVTFLLEPLNRGDRPNYLLGTPTEVLEVLNMVADPQVAMMYDIYHAQVSEGNITNFLRDQLINIGHIQIAGVPARAEPDKGELDYCYILQILDELGWDGWIGCEYAPAGETAEGLAWIEKFTENRRGRSELRRTL